MPIVFAARRAAAPGALSCMARAAAVALALAACSAPSAHGSDDGVAVDATVAADGALPDDAGGTASPADAAPAPEPFWSSEMTDGASGFYTRHQDEGRVELGAAAAGAGDGVAARIVFPGLPGLGNGDRVSPAFASELATQRADFHFGIYRVRVALAACDAGEEVVNGIFTYFNDGTDHDGDGLIDNSEIDFEVLCGTPDVLFMTVWTDYAPASETFRKWTYAIDFATGDLWESPDADQYGIERVGNDPALARPGFLAPGAFIELGFEWRADRVRFFATIDGQPRTLAELTDPARVPQLPAHLMFNVWHPAQHWFGGGGPPDYPATDATLLVDRAAYWK